MAAAAPLLFERANPRFVSLCSDDILDSSRDRRWRNSGVASVDASSTTRISNGMCGGFRRMEWTQFWVYSSWLWTGIMMERRVGPPEFSSSGYARFPSPGFGLKKNSRSRPEPGAPGGCARSRWPVPGEESFSGKRRLRQGGCWLR